MNTSLFDNYYMEIPIDRCKEICIGECNKYIAITTINNWIWMPLLASVLIALASIAMFNRSRVHAKLLGYMPDYPEENIDKLIGWFALIAMMLLSAFIIIVMTGAKLT